MQTNASAWFKFETALFFLAALGFCGTATHFEWFQTFDLALYDRLINALETPLADDLVIVGIDEQSLSAYGAWPWPRQLQARLLREISSGQPDAVLVDVVYGGQSEPSADQQLVDAAATVQTLALPLLIDALATNRQLIEVLPYPALLEQADVLGHAHVELDGDAIARGVYLYQGISDAYWPHVALALAQALGRSSAAEPDCPAAAFTIQNQRCEFVYLSFVGPPGSVPEISASDVLEGRLSGTELRNKIVFVGITTAAAPDSITSPVSGNDRPMPGVEFNVNLFNALSQEHIIRPGTPTLLLVIALLSVVLPVVLLPRLRPKAMLSATVTFAMLPVLMSIAGFVVFRLHLPMAAAIFTCLLCYPYWSWRRHEIAWRFVDGEMSRLALEKSRWVLSEAQSVAQATEMLRTLLRADAVWYDDSPSIPHDRQIALPGAEGRWLVLSRGEPFSAAEREFANKVQPVFDVPQASSQLPGEMLAAQIRRLQAAAEEVRLGREVGLRGLEEMPNGVAVVSLLNQVLLANRACTDLLALPEGIEGLSLDALVKGLVPPLGRSWQEISRAVILEQQTVTFETQTAAAIPVVIEAAPLAEAGEIPDSWVITITNMADVRVAERHREEALAFLSHDLRSPMLSVLALVRSARKSELLEAIEQYAQKALAVSEQFLQLSRVQARETFETYEVDLAAVLDNAIDQVFHSAAEQKITVGLRLDCRDDEGAWITGNGELLERTFVNLLTNAIKYSEQGASIDVTLTEAEALYTVAVEDQGIGIPAHEVDRIFDPYFRSEEPGSAAQRGAGLGLRFVKTVIERHGGTIDVTSRLGEGTRFVVTLPRTTAFSE